MIKEELSKIKEAKQVGVLYHYTGIKNWDRIKSSNTLEAGSPIGDYNKSRQLEPKNISDREAISFTRNKNLHKQPYFWDLGLNLYGGKIIRIAIDGDKLSERYKLKPFRWRFDKSRVAGGMSGDEFETRADTNMIKNLDKYLVKVDDVTSETTDLRRLSVTSETKKK